MKPTGLYLRIGLPFLLLMLFATVGIAIAMRAQLTQQAQERLAQLADADASFLATASLQPSEKLAHDLGRVSGVRVFFRSADRVLPEPEPPLTRQALLSVPADGASHVVGAGHEAVARELARGGMLLVRPVEGGLWDPRIVQAVVASWALAVLIAVLFVRGLVRPLRNLAAQLPNIENPQPLSVPESNRGDEIGDVARALVAAHTDLHRERERRIEAEKLAVLGRMTASLAHQLQNPVAAIKMHTQLWQMDRGDEGPAATIAGEARRIERMLNQWMYLTRPEPPAMHSADVGELIDELLRLHAPRLEHARVQVRFERDGALRIDGDRERLGHLFENLLTNAVQAMPDGGRVVIRARRDDGGDIVIEFDDAGAGFSAEALRRFGEFFYSEKEGGMGIGLAVAREVAVAHGGELHAGNIATGARLTVRLPRQKERTA